MALGVVRGTTFASKGGLQLLELFEVRLSLCVGAEARMNCVLYISYLLLVTHVIFRL